MTPPAPPATRRLLIQIDGLAKSVLDHALADDAMPALAGLVRSDNYDTIPVFSGLPSTTPAAQGELFYGVRRAVPAFTYLEDRHATRHMFEPESAGAVQQRLEREGAGLLEGGSSNCNIYTGGARVARFCPAALVHPIASLVENPKLQADSLASQAGATLRSTLMLASELARQFLSGSKRADAPRVSRLKDAWARILLTVAMRDNGRLAALRDIERGLPTVHLNFLGYDKQAHRYGPDAPPAVRTLKGIDTAIGSLLDAIDSDTTVMVYSDHGQEHTTPIHTITGSAISDIVLSALRDAGAGTDDNDASARESERKTDRIRRSLVERVGEEFLGVNAAQRTDDEGRTVTTLESGPIAHVYLDQGLEQVQRTEIARRVARAAPGVAAISTDRDADPSACLREHGPMPLSALCDDHLVAHPFADQIAPHLESLARHPDAGDLILLGTGFTDEPITFADERGSHGGPGPRETHAFAILPRRLRDDASQGDGPVRFEGLRAALMAERDE